MQKKTWLKILVPILIVAVICAMWFVKNPPKEAVSLVPEDNVFCLTETGPIDYETLSAYGLPILVDYGSDACIPCIQMAPVLEKLNAEMQGKAFIKFVDVRQYYEATSNMPVQLIPSQFFFNADGTAYVPSEDVQKQIGGFKLYSEGEKHTLTIHEGGLTEEQMRLILVEMGVQ